jgi:hypothetical protein
MDERRKFFRHPVDVPIQIFPQQLRAGEHVPMSDIGEGGIAFQTNVFFENGARLKVRIPHVHPPFEAVGVVCWHRSLDDQLEVGLMFLNEVTPFRVRMVEQICQIEKYRNQLRVEGHAVSFQNAASEWVEKFAADFGNN